MPFVPSGTLHFIIRFLINILFIKYIPLFDQHSEAFYFATKVNIFWKRFCKMIQPTIFFQIFDERIKIGDERFFYNISPDLFIKPEHGTRMTRITRIFAEINKNIKIHENPCHQRYPRSFMNNAGSIISGIFDFLNFELPL